MSEKLIPDIEKKKKPNKKQLEIVEKLRNCKNITNYLEFETRGTTTRNYGGYIRDFFICLEIENPSDYFKDPRLIKDSEKKVEYLDNIETDIRIFNKRLQDKSGSNRKSQLSAIRELLGFNKIELSNHFWKNIRKVGKKAETETEIKTLTPKQLRNVLSHANTFEKAVFLTMLSSYSRIKQTIEIELDQLHLERYPPQIQFYSDNEKNGKPITKFISIEAKEHIEEYLPNREKYLNQTLKYSKNLVKNKSKLNALENKYKNRLFPISLSAIETRWNKLCKKENLYILDNRTKQPIYGTHSLRRYFEDNIGNAKLAKYLANKVPKGQSTYQYRTEYKLEDEYKQYEKNIWVFKENDETLKRLNENEKELEETKGKLEIVTDRLKSYEEKYKILSDKFDLFEDNLKVAFDPYGIDMREFLNIMHKSVKPMLSEEESKELDDYKYDYLENIFIGLEKDRISKGISRADYSQYLLKTGKWKTVFNDFIEKPKLRKTKANHKKL